jgi:hypothetical protein
MAGKKTFVAGEVLTAQDVNDYLMDQSVMNFASAAARSSAIPTPTEGMFAVTTDNDELDYYNGSDWVPALPVGAWQSWSPVLSNTWANGNGVWDAKYIQIGKTVHVAASFVLGTTTTKGASVARVSLPVTAAATSRPFISSPCPITVAGASGPLMFASINNTTDASFFTFNASATYLTRNNVSSTVPGVWATSDVMQMAFTYEAV